MNVPEKKESREIKASGVKYIKLGGKGGWENECLDKGIIRFGYNSSRAERYQLCLEGRWDKLKESRILGGKSKGAATKATNAAQAFFEDAGNTLWITFVGEKLYWGFVEPVVPERHSDNMGVFRRIVGGWSCVDVNGQELVKSKLFGALTKIVGFRGTICGVKEAVKNRVLLRINGRKTPEAKKAEDALATMKNTLVDCMRSLEPHDFELLVDLIFSASGWRRQGGVGKTHKTLDLDLILPTTGEKAFVQVKSATNQKELDEYERLNKNR